jgi:N6-adenosine-specific RNA methylase IME4
MTKKVEKTPSEKRGLIEMKYKTVYADPPWNERGGGKIKRGADRHYNLLHTDDIIDVMKKIPIDDNAHLYLWVTNSFLKDGLLVMEELGFKYKTNIVWVKDRFGLGQYFRGQHEICLFGVKGHLPYKHKIDPNRSCCDESTVIICKRTKHSKKPFGMYEKIEKTSYPPFIEVFAREQKDGWDAYGDQLSSTIQLDKIDKKEKHTQKNEEKQK